MRLKMLLALAATAGFSQVAFADIDLTFSSPVNTVSFYSSQAYALTATTNGTSALDVVLSSDYGSGAVTPFADTNVTSWDFSGTPDYYVLDNIMYNTGGVNYTLTFDESALVEGDSVDNFYAGMPGGPTFSDLGVVLTYPNYNYGGYPYDSSPSVIYESSAGPGPSPTPPVPEPGTLALFGSGIVGLAGMLRRKFARAL